MRSIRSRQQGFTLVEIAIVLVIIGLIIGGVLGGQQVITNARIKALVNDLQGFQAAFQTYNQNYRALPGDDSQAIERFSNVSAEGNGDGTVGATALSTTFNRLTAPETGTAESESQLAWLDLRAAGLIKGSAVDYTQPTNPFNGIYGIQNGAYSSGLGGSVVCANDVPGLAAQAIDSQMDDGAPDTGNMRGGPEDLTGAAATAYVGGTLYVVCTSL